METIYFLIPLAMVLLALAIAAFSWAARSGQFEDLDRESKRILFDEDAAQIPDSAKTPQDLPHRDLPNRDNNHG